MGGSPIVPPRRIGQCDSRIAWIQRSCQYGIHGSDDSLILLRPNQQAIDVIRCETQEVQRPGIWCTTRSIIGERISTQCVDLIRVDNKRLIAKNRLRPGV